MKQVATRWFSLFIVRVMCRMAASTVAQLVYIVGKETDGDYQVFWDMLGHGRERDALELIPRATFGSALWFVFDFYLCLLNLKRVIREISS